MTGSSLFQGDSLCLQTALTLTQAFLTSGQHVSPDHFPRDPSLALATPAPPVTG